MSDRERIEKGLNICTSEEPCNGCPYLGERNCSLAMVRDALDLLKEQEAVVPYIDIDEAKCPNCKVKLTRQELIGDDVLFEDFFDFCPHCGKAVKWE